MPEGEDDSKLHWKRGVPTTGVGRIVTTVADVDQWMAVDAVKFAKLYTLTKDELYLEVTRSLLHNTKNMLALRRRSAPRRW